MYALKLFGGLDPLKVIDPPFFALGEAAGSGVSRQPCAGYHLTAAGAFADALKGEFRPLAPDAFQRLFELAAHLREVFPVVRAVFV